MSVLFAAISLSAASWPGSIVAPETGMVLDLKTLKSLINEKIVNKVDHKNFNVDVDFMHGIIPTAENIAIKFWEILEANITNGKLYEVKLFESERNFVVYRGENVARTD